jgi:hypothetical protein
VTVKVDPSNVKDVRSLETLVGTVDDVVGVPVVGVDESTAEKGFDPPLPHAPTTSAKAHTLVKYFILPNLFWVSIITASLGKLFGVFT